MGLLRYFLIPLSRSSGHAIMALTCFGLRLTASGSQDADLGSTGRCSHLQTKGLKYQSKLSDNATHQAGAITVQADRDLLKAPNRRFRPGCE